MGDRVRTEIPEYRYTTEGTFESDISKEYPGLDGEIDSFYDFVIGDSEEYVPAGIFSHDFGPLQALVKYLHEEKGLSHSEISRLTNRDPRTIWATYDKVGDEEISWNDSEATIPLSIFSDREFAPLECIVRHFLSEELSISEIASLLGRSYQTIWTVKRRIGKKGGGGA